MPPPPSPPAESLIEELLGIAVTAAVAGGDLIRAETGRDHDVSAKTSPTDLVTEVDRASERRVVEIITAARPDDGILGEEGSTRPGTSGVRWVIDPLDGTTNFLFGVPAYAVSVGVEAEGLPVAGAVVDSSRDEVWHGALGRGAFLNGRRLAALEPVGSLATSLVATGFSYLPERRSYQARVATHVLPRVRDIRRFGAAALDLCWVAAGRFNAFYELGLQPWDLAAGNVIAQEAGAGAAWLVDGTYVVAAPGLLEPLCSLLESAVAEGPA